MFVVLVLGLAVICVATALHLLMMFAQWRGAKGPKGPPGDVGPPGYRGPRHVRGIADLSVDQEPAHDTNWQPTASDHERTGACDASDHAQLVAIINANRNAIHSLTQALRSTGNEPPPGACPCEFCTAPPIAVVPSDGNVIQGWRIYEIGLGQGWEPCLTGQGGATWTDRRLSAVCHRRAGPVTSHLLEPEDCSCGIYMLKSDPRPPETEHVQTDRYSRRGPSFGITMVAFALCVAYGTVIEATDGYRASEVRIDELWITDGPEWLTKELLRIYDVPVHRLNDRKPQTQAERQPTMDEVWKA